MAKEGFFHRLFDGGLYRILTGYDLYLSALVTVLIWFCTSGNLSTYNSSTVLNDAISYSTSLTAVIVTGISIIVALSDPVFLRLLKRKKIFQNFMFTFEYTAILSIITSVYGIYISSIGYDMISFLVFVWLFLYLVLAVSRVVSQIVSLGIKRGDVSLVEELSEMVEESQESDQSTNTKKER